MTVADVTQRTNPPNAQVPQVLRAQTDHQALLQAMCARPCTQTRRKHAAHAEVRPKRTAILQDEGKAHATSIHNNRGDRLIAPRPVRVEHSPSPISIQCERPVEQPVDCPNMRLPHCVQQTAQDGQLLHSDRHYQLDGGDRPAELPMLHHATHHGRRASGMCLGRSEFLRRCQLPSLPLTARAHVTVGTLAESSLNDQYAIPTTSHRQLLPSDLWPARQPHE